MNVSASEQSENMIRVWFMRNGLHIGAWRRLSVELHGLHGLFNVRNVKVNGKVEAFGNFEQGSIHGRVIVLSIIQF